MSSLPTLKDAALEVEGRVAVLTLKRDDVRNALTGTHLVDDIVAALEWANGAMEISVLVLTGAGAAFSAGGNIKTMRERSSGSTTEELERYYRHGVQRIPRAMQLIEVPVIAAVNGPAIGAGFDLANMCDLRIGSTAAQFGETFINLGIMAGDGGPGTAANGFLRGLGMAPGARLVEQLYSPTFTQAGGMLTLMTQSYANGAVLSGNALAVHDIERARWRPWSCRHDRARRRRSRAHGGLALGTGARRAARGTPAGAGRASESAALSPRSTRCGAKPPWAAARAPG
jgi:hypothetical protein